MGSPAIFNGPFAKLLKDQLKLSNTARILTGTVDPRIVATEGESGSLYMLQGTPGELYMKLDEGTTTNWQKMGREVLVANEQELINGAHNLNIDNYFPSSDSVAAMKAEYSAYKKYEPTPSDGVIQDASEIYNTLFPLNGLPKAFDGVINADWTANAAGGGKIPTPFNYVYNIIVDSNQNTYVSGTFENYDSLGYDRFIKLDSKGNIDTTFCDNASTTGMFDNAARAAAIQSDGKILVGGTFTDYGGFGYDRLIRLNTDGTLDNAFCANASAPGHFLGTVQDIAVQSDGKILVSGQFNDYEVAGRNKLVRLNEDGTLDTTFCSNAVDGGKFNSIYSVSSLTIQSDGKILVGGDYVDYNSTVGRNRLIRLNEDGTVDTTFCNNASDGNKFPNSTITCTAVQSDGKILASGGFTNYNGTTGRNRLVRLNSDGTLDTVFCNNAVDSAQFSTFVDDIEIQSDGEILIGGDFVNYKTSGRNHLIRLFADGTLDTAFCANASDGTKIESRVVTVVSSPGITYFGGRFDGYITPNNNCLAALQNPSVLIGQLNGQIRVIKKLNNGKIILGGDFTSFNENTDYRYLIRLNSDGTFDTVFNNNLEFDGFVLNVAEQSDGKLVVGGLFSDYGAAGNDRLIRLNKDGTLDTTFTTNASSSSKFNGIFISGLAIQPDNKILVGGDFSSYSSSYRNIIRLNTDGTLDNAFCDNASSGSKFSGGLVYDIKMFLGTKILVGGQFTNYDSSGSSHFICFNADGTLDTAFTAAVNNGKITGTVRVIQTQSNSQVLIGGEFTNYDGEVNRNRLVRVNVNGTLDLDFVQNAVDVNKFNNDVLAIEVRPDNKILVGGNFTNYSVTGCNGLTRLESDGSLDTNFVQKAVISNHFNAGVLAISSLSQDEIAIGGGFTTYHGLTERNYITILNRNGVISFLSNAILEQFNGEIYSIVEQADGKVLIGGDFTNYAGLHSYLIRLNADGSLDTDFCNNAVDGRFNNNIQSIAIDSQNRIVVGGWFTDYDGLGYNRLIRLLPDGTLDDVGFCNQLSTINNNIYVVQVDGSDSVFIGGSFTNYQTTSRNRFLKLNSDGTLATAFNTNATDGEQYTGDVFAIEIQSNGKILVGGAFDSHNFTMGRDYLVRINTDGTLDTAFCANAVDPAARFNNHLRTIASQSDNKILVGGFFTNYVSAGNNHLIRLNEDGTLDTTFTTNASGSSKFSNDIYSVSVMESGDILVGGEFIDYLAAGRDNFVCLTSTGTLNTAFSDNTSGDSKFNTTVYEAYNGDSQRIYIGGGFENYDDIYLANYLVMFEAVTAADKKEQGSFLVRYIPDVNEWQVGGRAYTGDDVGLEFSANNNGQVLYTAEYDPNPLEEFNLKWTTIDL